MTKRQRRDRFVAGMVLLDWGSALALSRAWDTFDRAYRESRWVWAAPMAERP